MKSERIWIHPEAVSEAQAAYEWYHQRSPNAAEAFMDELERGIDRIVEGPSRWPPFGAGTRRFLMRRFPFHIVFREAGEMVQILAVAHARRRPGYWRDR